jgi:hypothetical protein
MRSRAIAGVLLAAALGALGSPRVAGAPRERHEVGRAVIEWEVGTLEATEVSAFAQLVDRGVADIEALVAPGLPQWAQRTRRIRVVVSSRAQISRAYGRTVLLPVARVRSRTAPYLHEITHVLVPSRGDRIWLSEGFASYLEAWVSENRGGYDAHVFSRAGDRGIHAAARRWLSREQGRAVLPWVGSRGEPPGMDWNRSRVARPFYVLSHSFTKYLVDHAGLTPMVGLLVDGEDDAAFLRLTEKSETEWKSEWLAAIGVPEIARS